MSKDERSKLDVKSRQCVFISYGHENTVIDFMILLKKSLSKAMIMGVSGSGQSNELDKSEPN